MTEGRHKRERVSEGQIFPFRTRLVIGYLVVLLVFLISSGVIFYQFERVYKANQVLREQMQLVVAAEDLSRSVSDLIIAVDTGLLSEDSVKFETLVNEALDGVERSYARLREAGGGSAALDTAVSVLMGDIRPMILQARGDSWNVLRRNRLTRLNDKVLRVQNTVVHENLRELQDTQERYFRETTSAYIAVRLTILLSFIIALLLSFVFGSKSYRGIVGILSKLVSGVQRLAQGDLDYRVHIDTGDELADLAEAFNSMAGQLQKLYSHMEQRIAERTAELEGLAEQMKASAEIGQAATTILNLESLQRRVVNLISERFGFYHTGLFMLDEEGHYVVLQAASSPGGQRMLKRHHRLRVGEGIVGFVVETGEAHIASTVGKDAVFFSNPDLPETRSEAALPLRARGRILGALDVQSTVENAFTEENITILQMMADQVAMAMDNARLYQSAQEDARELRQLYGEYERLAWADYVRSIRGRRYLRGRGISQNVTWYPEMAQALAEKQPVLASSESEEAEQTTGIALPILVRDHVVGVIDLRKADGGTWSSGELELVKTVVSQLGLAMESARLYQDIQRQAAQSRMVEEIAARMRRTLDVATVARTAVDEIRQRLRVAQVSLYLSSPTEEAKEPNDETE